MELIEVEVAYALPDEQVLLKVRVAAGATLRDAIDASGILRRFPQIDLARDAVGVFGKVAKLDDRLSAGDRVEIYRPLTMDPKQARRQRALKKRQPG
ncbi:MAG TPA: RnfH family protein [Nevskiaceae bacterium]|nr:RnfH family protein [Nevskiaceae bacterium]